MAPKDLQCGFYWLTSFWDAYTFCSLCERCQCMGKITRWNMKPLNPILLVKIFNIQGIDFVGLFPPFGHQYIMVAFNFIFKWIEAISYRTHDHKVVTWFFKSNIVSHFGFPWVIINDGAHFYNNSFKALLTKYYIIHKLATSYH